MQLVFPFFIYLVSYYGITAAQNTKTAICISLGFHIPQLACFQDTCDSFGVVRKARNAHLPCPSSHPEETQGRSWGTANNTKSNYQARSQGVLKFGAPPNQERKKDNLYQFSIVMHVLWVVAKRLYFSTLLKGYTQHQKLWVVLKTKVQSVLETSDIHATQNMNKNICEIKVKKIKLKLLEMTKSINKGEVEVKLELKTTYRFPAMVSYQIWLQR